MWLFVLFALVVYGFANFYRKTALGGLDPVIAGFIESASQMLFAWVAVLLFAEFSLSALTFDSVAAGFALFLGLTLLYAALKTGYASSVATIINLNALVTVPLALFFLGESLSLQGVAGVALAVLVVPLLGSLRVNGGAWLKYAVASMVILGVMNYFNAAAVNASGAFLAFAFFMTAATLFYAVFILARKRRELSKVRALDLKRLSISGFCFAVATLFTFTAFSLGPASIIIPVVNMNLVVTAFLSSAFYKEKLGWKGWAAVALAVASVWLLAG